MAAPPVRPVAPLTRISASVMILLLKFYEHMLLYFAYLRVYAHIVKRFDVTITQTGHRYAKGEEGSACNRLSSGRIKGELGPGTPLVTPAVGRRNRYLVPRVDLVD